MLVKVLIVIAFVLSVVAFIMAVNIRKQINKMDKMFKNKK